MKSSPVPARAELENAERPKRNHAERDARAKSVMRWASDTLCLWGLCAKAKCRRARQCRGEPSDCLSQYTPIVPEDAEEGIKAMLEGMRRRMIFEEVCEMWPEEIDAVQEWAGLVMSSADKAIRA